MGWTQEYMTVSVVCIEWLPGLGKFWNELLFVTWNDSPTTYLFRSTLTQTIAQYKLDSTSLLKTNCSKFMSLMWWMNICKFFHVCYLSAKKYDAFLASESLIRQIPRILGPGLNKAGKFPTSLTHNDNMVQKIEEVRSTIKFQMKKVGCLPEIRHSAHCN